MCVQTQCCGVQHIASIAFRACCMCILCARFNRATPNLRTLFRCCVCVAQHAKYASVLVHIWTPENAKKCDSFPLSRLHMSRGELPKQAVSASGFCILRWKLQPQYHLAMRTHLLPLSTIWYIIVVGNAVIYRAFLPRFAVNVLLEVLVRVFHSSNIFYNIDQINMQKCIPAINANQQPSWYKVNNIWYSVTHPHLIIMITTGSHEQFDLQKSNGIIVMGKSRMHCWR